MDVLDAIKTRRSIRKYRRQAIPREIQEKILEAGRWAPSAGNQQAREFILVERRDIRERLAAAAYGQGFIAEAPLVIVVCASKARSGSRYGARGEGLYALQDAAASTQNMLLAVHALGLGSCWVGAFDEEEVCRVLNLPEGVYPTALLPVGFPGENPRPPGRRSEVRREKW